ncbi:MAG TPA: hypothetical protein DDZ51_02800 [Planctomycetaceae bacterium]|nr:hypothetical protein [Planctomycetaceae bacterium]
MESDSSRWRLAPIQSCFNTSQQVVRRIGKQVIVVIVSRNKLRVAMLTSYILAQEACMHLEPPTAGWAGLGEVKRHTESPFCSSEKSDEGWMIAFKTI